MIVYGSRAKQIGTEQLAEKCPNCGTQNSTTLHVFQKYAHVFWIPFFPTGKTGASECQHCKQVVKSKEMSAPLASSYNTLKAQSKTPVWMFSGVALVVVLITVAFISDKQNDKKNAELILAPQKGDIFEIRTEDRQYTLFKVDDVQGDSVYIQPSSYETNKASGLSDLKKKEYADVIIGYAKPELKKMLESGEIIDIERK